MSETKGLLGKVEGTDKSEVVENLTDEQLLGLFKPDWPESLLEFLTQEQMLQVIKGCNLERLLDVSTTGGQSGCGSWAPRVQTGIKTHGFKVDTIEHNHKMYEHRQSFYENGVVCVGMHRCGTEAIVRGALELLFPYLKEFECNIYRVTYDENPEIYVKAEKTIYTPISALITGDIEAILKRTSTAGEFWPKAGILTDEDTWREYPTACKFFTAVEENKIYSGPNPMEKTDD